MSRIGKHPVPVPKGVEVALAGQTPHGFAQARQARALLPEEVQIAQNDGALTVQPRGDGKRARAMWGLSRTLVANMVEGVSKGFTRKLVISGVGFARRSTARSSTCSWATAHDIKYAVPDDIDVKCETPTAITITGADRQRVGQIAADCARSACRSPTRARASATTTR